MTKKRIFALIPARKGSQGLINKNMYLINGKPLIYYTIFFSKKSKFIKGTCVSSDSDEILNYAKKMNVSYIKRPLKISKNNALAADVVKHFFEKRKIRLNDILIYLQPTSPCRNNKIIDQAIKLFLKYKKPVVSVSKNKSIILKSYLIKNNILINPFKKSYHNENRQNLPQTYSANGAIYIFTKKQFTKSKGFPVKNIFGYIMKENESFDIDDKKYLKVIKKELKKL